MSSRIVSANGDVGITSVLRRYYVGITSVLRRYYVGITSVLRRYYVGITSVLRRYYVGITSVLRRYYVGITSSPRYAPRARPGRPAALRSDWPLVSVTTHAQWCPKRRRRVAWSTASPRATWWRSWRATSATSRERSSASTATRSR